MFTLNPYQWQSGDIIYYNNSNGIKIYNNLITLKKRIKLIYFINYLLYLLLKWKYKL